MSSSRWTPQKDAILVEKYDELKGDFEQINFFYERSVKLNMNNLIKPVMVESTYLNEKSLDDEFNDAINYFDTSNLIQNNS